MNKIYLIRDLNGNPIKSLGNYNKTWCYKTLGNAKTAARRYVKNKNRFLQKDERISFEELKVVECNIIKEQDHPI